MPSDGPWGVRRLDRQASYAGWVAVPLGGRRQRGARDPGGRPLPEGQHREAVGAGAVFGMENAGMEGCGTSGERTGGAEAAMGAAVRSEGLCDAGGMERADGRETGPGEPGVRDLPPGGVADAAGEGREGRMPGRQDQGRRVQGGRSGPDGADCGPRNPWADCRWIYCRDGKIRPTQSRIFPLADGFPGRVGLLRGYGNAIVPQVGAAFIEAFLEAEKEQGD